MNKWQQFQNLVSHIDFEKKNYTVTNLMNCNFKIANSLRIVR